VWIAAIRPIIVILPLPQNLASQPEDRSNNGKGGDVKNEVEHFWLPHFFAFRFFGDDLRLLAGWLLREVPFIGGADRARRRASSGVRGCRESGFSRCSEGMIVSRHVS
jgi:hypothetical protein